ncbi:hypothetical protein PR048_014603 [Dryococelus australis]|uniref:Uncharacterized protein n=1 Tax=Dryococelus australis TaxID=614101 RepID=A0ABQ9HEW2_9NEOP|nr:hypothetical protein PR048_014603 [Dryococelus australis]
MTKVRVTLQAQSPRQQSPPAAGPSLVHVSRLLRDRGLDVDLDSQLPADREKPFETIGIKMCLSSYSKRAIVSRPLASGSPRVYRPLHHNSLPLPAGVQAGNVTVCLIGCCVLRKFSCWLAAGCERPTSRWLADGLPACCRPVTPSCRPVWRSNSRLERLSHFYSLQYRLFTVNSGHITRLRQWRTGFDSRRGGFPRFTPVGERGRRCCWLKGCLGMPLFPPTITLRHCSVSVSLRPYRLFVFRHKTTKYPSVFESRLFLPILCNELHRGRGGVVGRLLTSHQGKLGSIPGGVASGFSQVGIVPDDAAGRRVFLGIFSFPNTCVPELLHTHLTPPSSALNTSMLRAAQISSPTHPVELGVEHRRNEGAGKREITEKTRRPAESNPVRLDGRRISDIPISTCPWSAVPMTKDTAPSVTLAYIGETAVTKRLDCSLPTKASRVKSPADSLPDFCKWESYPTMPLVDGFSRGSPVSPALALRRCSTLTLFHPHRLSRPRMPRRTPLTNSDIHNSSPMAKMAGLTHPRESISFDEEGGEWFNHYASDKLYFKRVYTLLTFALGSEFIGDTLDDSAPIADVQGNKKRIPYCQMWGNTWATANEQTSEWNPEQQLKTATPRAKGAHRRRGLTCRSVIYWRVSKRRAATVCPTATAVLSFCSDRRRPACHPHKPQPPTPTLHPSEPARLHNASHPLPSLFCEVLEVSHPDCLRMSIVATDLIWRHLPTCVHIGSCSFVDTPHPPELPRVQNASHRFQPYSALLIIDLSPEVHDLVQTPLHLPPSSSELLRLHNANHPLSNQDMSRETWPLPPPLSKATFSEDLRYRTSLKLAKNQFYTPQTQP